MIFFGEAAAGSSASAIIPSLNVVVVYNSKQLFLRCSGVCIFLYYDYLIINDRKYKREEVEKRGERWNFPCTMYFLMEKYHFGKRVCGQNINFLNMLYCLSFTVQTNSRVSLIYRGTSTYLNVLNFSFCASRSHFQSKKYLKINKIILYMLYISSIRHNKLTKRGVCPSLNKAGTANYCILTKLADLNIRVCLNLFLFCRNWSADLLETQTVAWRRHFIINFRRELRLP